jgi:hypothetical protein
MGIEESIEQDLEPEEILEASFRFNYIKGIKHILDNYKLYGKDTKFIVSCYMKKERIGFLLSVICNPDIKDELIKVLETIKPNKIAINFSRNSSLADGMTYGLYLELMDHLKETRSCIFKYFGENIEITGTLTPSDDFLG